MALSWRSFQFFECDVVKEDVPPPAAGARGQPQQPANALEKLEVTCATSGLGKLVFGDHEGWIHVYDRTFAANSWVAYSNQVTHMKQLRKHNLLFTVGEDAGTDGSGSTGVPVVKVWLMDTVPGRREDRREPVKTQPLFSSGGKGGPDARPDKPSRLQLNLNQAMNLQLRGNSSGGAAADAPAEGGEEGKNLTQSDIQSPVTCIDVTEDKDFFACGLSNGEVVLLRGDFVKQTKLKRYPLRRPARMGGRDGDEPDLPVTWVGFKKLQAGRDADPLKKPDPPHPPPALTTDCHLLYVMYPNGGMLWVCPQKDAPPTPLAMMPGDDGGRACQGCDLGCACIIEDFPKKQDWRLVVAKDDTIDLFGGRIEQPTQMAGTFRPWAGSASRRVGVYRSYLWVVAKSPESSGYDQLQIYDLGNKLKALTKEQGVVRNMVCASAEWGSIFALCQDPKEEKYVCQKLFQFEERDKETKLDLLFRKSMYGVAIQLASTTQEFDKQQVMDIHKKYGDWFYQKPDYKNAVDQYILTIGSLEPSYVIRKFLDAQRIHDLTRYLEALHDKQVANVDHTTLLLNCYTKLKNQEKLDDFIDIHESRNNEQKVRTFDVDTAIKVCRQAGYYEHAEILARKHRHHQSYLLITIEDRQKYREGLDYIHQLDLADAEEQLRIYGKTLVSHLPEATTTLLMEICTEWKRQDGAAGTPGARDDAAQPPAKPPGPDEFLPCFVDAPFYLMQFLENVAKNKLEFADSDSGGTSMVYNTLLELYLTRNLKKSIASGSYAVVDDESREDIEAEAEDYEERKRKALTLLKDYGHPVWKYDREHALVLVQTHNFREGILYLYEQLQLYQDILQYYMKQGDYDEVIATCERFGKQDPNMWVQVLLFFVQLHESQDVTIELQKVLQLIDKDSHLPPLVVIDILSKNSKTKLETIKAYVIARLTQEMESIQSDQEKIKEHQIQTYKMRNDIRDLQSNAQIFQLSKCSHCTTALDLPAVHFMCKHSYHQRCLTEKENECPLCTRDFSKVVEMKRQLDEQVEDHDQFFQELEEKKGDGFSVIAKYFSRSIFNGEYPNPDEAGGDLLDLGGLDL